MIATPVRGRLLAAVSVAQLATGAAGMVVALRRRHPYHVFWMRGRADAIARDAILKGTALSAPLVVLSGLSAEHADPTGLARRKGHAGVLTHKPAVREIAVFLRADRPPGA